MPPDPIVLAVVAAGAVVLALVTARAIRLGQGLDAVAAAAGAPGEVGADAVAAAVARLARRAADAELRADQVRRDLEYLLDLVGIGIVRLSDDLRVEVANAAAHHYLGREPGAMEGRTAIEAFGHAELERLARAALDGGPGSIELRLREPDGPVLVARARRSPILGVWLVLEDVAELRRLQRIRREFIDNLSHELRTPITTVGLLSEALERDAESAGASVPARMVDRIAKIRVETANIGQMVEELLDLSRIEGGEAPLLLDDVDLCRLAVESVERLGPFAERTGVRLVVDLPDPCPRVRGDAARLGQVLVNLLHNAVKFSPNGGTVTLRIRAAGDGTIEASVEDHGIGIAAADLERIFERFYKADRARVRGGGTGLGLAIARHVVESHGGRIRARSAPGEGSTFSFTLPVAATAPLTEGRWTA